MAETHYDTANIIVGTAMLYVAPVGTPAPVVPPTNVAPTIDPLWVPMGYTDAGIKFAYAVSNKDISVDEEMAPVDVLPDKETVKVSCGLAEATLENLNRAIAGGTLTTIAVGVGVAGESILQVGSRQTNQKFACLLIGNGPKGFTRMVNLYRAIATSNMEMTYKRAEKVMVPVEFTGLALSANAAGNRLFQIIDKTAQGI